MPATALIAAAGILTFTNPALQYDLSGCLESGS